MSSLLAMPGEEVANRLVQLAADFVAVLRDPNSRLDDLAAATSAAEAKIAEANAAGAAADEERAAIKRERAEHEDALLIARQKLDADRSTYERSRTAQQAEDAATRAQTLRDSETVATKLKELNAKLAAIQSAAAA